MHNVCFLQCLSIKVYTYSVLDLIFMHFNINHFMPRTVKSLILDIVKLFILHSVIVQKSNEIHQICFLLSLIEELVMYSMLF